MTIENLEPFDFGADSHVYLIDDDKYVLKRYRTGLSPDTIGAYVRVMNAVSTWGVCYPRMYRFDNSEQMLWQVRVTPVIGYSDTDPWSSISDYVPGPHVLKWLQFTDAELTSELKNFSGQEKRILADWKQRFLEEDVAEMELYFYWQGVVELIHKRLKVSGLAVRPMNVKPEVSDRGIIWNITDLTASLRCFEY